MAFCQDSEKKGKYKFEDFDKCSSKILLARSETEDPLDLLLTSPASAERPREREGQTHPKVTSQGPEVRRLGRKSWDQKGSHSQWPRLLLHMSPPPWGYSQEVSFVLYRRKGHPQTKSAP